MNPPNLTMDSYNVRIVQIDPEGNLYFLHDDDLVAELLPRQSVQQQENRRVSSIEFREGCWQAVDLKTRLVFCQGAFRDQVLQTEHRYIQDNYLRKSNLLQYYHELSSLG